MPIPLNGCCCSNGAFLVMAIAIILCPPYLIPNLKKDALPEDTSIQPSSQVSHPRVIRSDTWRILDITPKVDMFLTVILVSFGVVCYLCEWVQRRLMEKRILKLKSFLTESVERVRLADGQRTQLETTLNMVRDATNEYNLLLYLMLRQRKNLKARSQNPDINFCSDNICTEDNVVPNL